MMPKMIMPIAPGLDFFSFSSRSELVGATAGVAIRNHLEFEEGFSATLFLPLQTEYEDQVNSPQTADCTRVTLPASMQHESSHEAGGFRGDITRLAVDAILNAANTSMPGGAGVDRAAGPELLAACRQRHGCKTGSAKSTPGFRLSAKWVFHAVGASLAWRQPRRGGPACRLQSPGAWNWRLNMLRSIDFPRSARAWTHFRNSAQAILRAFATSASRFLRRTTRRTGHPILRSTAPKS
jgi:hypothetical protein